MIMFKIRRITSALIAACVLTPASAEFTVDRSFELEALRRASAKTAPAPAPAKVVVEETMPVTPATPQEQLKELEAQMQQLQARMETLREQVVPPTASKPLAVVAPEPLTLRTVAETGRLLTPEPTFHLMSGQMSRAKFFRAVLPANYKAIYRSGPRFGTIHVDKVRRNWREWLDYAGLQSGTRFEVSHPTRTIQYRGI